MRVFSACSRFHHVFLFLMSLAIVPTEECVKGFRSLSDVTNEAADGVAVGGKLFLFQNVNFSCEARIRKWIFAAQIPNGVILDSREPPLMQIWREKTDRYRRIFSTGNGNTLSITTEESAVNDRMLIHYTLNKEVTVQAGDMLGLFVNGGSNTPRFLPLFLDLGAGSGTSYLYTPGGHSSTRNLLFSSLASGKRYVPLVVVEYEVMSTTNAAILSTTTSARTSLQENNQTTSSMDLNSSIFGTEVLAQEIGGIIPSTIFPFGIKVSAGCIENNPMPTFTVNHHISISATVSEYPAATQNVDSQVTFILGLFLSSFVVALVIMAVSIFLLHRMKKKHRDSSCILSSR